MFIILAFQSQHVVRARQSQFGKINNSCKILIVDMKGKLGRYRRRWKEVNEMSVSCRNKES